ncbi:LOW QUALITY PROTEIN: RNA polymerase II-associated protein 1-like [Pomacea canaliculata]|uniref:LOW QUALITY PROTEIN: RNA polymerase II-associated protein 1-like n=1 Tax=Pomacea canaliculata TaxID=400727 RepID=UPI000D73ED7B|nr:LOW QUALITY PROTEIN: RNA polymerase II-associated protein 1-like [Pomacea canaliculata]
MDRPKRGEDENELLRFQQEFLASKDVPSVTIVNKADKRKPESQDRDVVKMDAMPALPASVGLEPAKKSRFRTDKDSRKCKSAASDSTTNLAYHSLTPDMDPEELMDKNDKGMAAVLTSIIERDTRNATFTFPSPTAKPFPPIMERSVTEQITFPQRRKQSLFASQFEQHGTTDFASEKEESKMEISESTGSRKPNNGQSSSSSCKVSSDVSSHIVDGRGLSASQAETEARSIHEENMSKLAKMSEEEILEEQKKLLQMLDPSLVEFLRSKSRKTVETKGEVESQTKSLPPRGKPKPPKQEPSKSEDLADMTSIERRQSWIHMDKVEYDKLEWMKDLPPPSADNAQTGLQARFDFSGRVVPADADLPVTMALHHHGDEPERAGYTLEELFQLARSSNVQQRTLALTTLGHIIQQEKAGTLIEYIQRPILPSILDGGVVFLIRMACDDSVPAVVVAAVFSLSALLCNPADEVASSGSYSAGYLADFDQSSSHSTRMAYEISRNTKLMNLITKEFLPTTWKPHDSEMAVSDPWGLPLPAAMRLMGSLCQAGRHIASSLVANHSLQEVLLRYLAVRAQDLHLSEKEAESLQRETFVTWRILLSYGLGSDIYLDLYTSLVNELRAVTSTLSNLDVYQLQDREVNLVSVFEIILPLAAIPPVKPCFNQEDGREMEVISTPVNWSHVEGVMPMIKVCTCKWLQHLADKYTLQKPCLQFPTACLNFMATYFAKYAAQATVNPLDQLQHIEEICSKSLFSFLKSFGFQTMLVSSVSTPILHLHQVKSAKKKLPTSGVIISHKDVISYLKKFSSASPNHLYANHFTKFENMMQYFLIKLSSLTPGHCQPLLHQLALDLTGRLQGGEEFIAHDLFSTVLFNADFIPEGKDEELTAASLAGMKISDAQVLKSATQEEVNTNNAQLLKESLSNLPEIRSQYFKTFAGMETSVASSRCRYQQLPHETRSLLTPPAGESIMPRDWAFMPLVHLYNHDSSKGSGTQTRLPSSFVTMTTCALQWIFILESLRNRALSDVSITLKISRIMCVFLVGNDLFLERSVYPFLASLFRVYATPHLLDKMNFEEDIPGISSFYDLYMVFLDQFEAVSFGDIVFGAYVMLPMQQKQSLMLRRAVWQERPHLLRTLRVPVQEMLIDISRYLTPDETDPQLVQLYTHALLSKSVLPTRTPALFLVAVHHTNRFLYYTQDTTNQPIRRRLWEQVLRCKDEELKRNIFYYKICNTEMKNSMELYAELPASRQKVLQEHQARVGP